MKTSKKVLVISLVLTVAFGLISVPGYSKDKTYVLRIAGTVSRPFFPWDAMDEWAKMLKEESKGRIKLVTYDGTLGGETEILERVQLNTLEGYLGSSGPLRSITNDPVFVALDIPFLFKSWDHYDRAMDSEFGKELNRIFLQRGIRGLAWGNIGARYIYYKGDAPALKPEDFKGKKIRVMENPAYVAFYKAMGAIPTPMSFTEIYTSLQLGTIDGVDTGLSSGYTSKHYEQVQYVSLTAHVYGGYLIAVSEKWWKTLPEDLQEIIERTAKKTAQIMTELEKKDTEEIIKKWRAGGVKVVDVDREAFRKVGMQILPQFRDQIGQRNIQLIEDAAK